METLYTVEFYSFVKKHEIKIADKWVDIENILREVTQTQEDKCHIFSFICSSLFYIFSVDTEIRKT